MNEVKFKANIKDVLALQAEVAAIPEIPTPETTDEGKVLTVAVDSSGETPVVSYELETPSGGLPAISAGDAGKVLTVNAGETGAEWATPSGGGDATVYYAVSDPEYQHTITTPPTNIVAPPTGATWEVDQNSPYDWYLTDTNNVPLTADQIQQVKVGDIVVVNDFNSYYPGSYLKGMVVGLKDVNAVDEYDQGLCQRAVYFQNVNSMGPSAAGYAFTAYNNP